MILYDLLYGYVVWTCTVGSSWFVGSLDSGSTIGARQQHFFLDVCSLSRLDHQPSLARRFFLFVDCCGCVICGRLSWLIWTFLTWGEALGRRIEPRSNYWDFCRHRKRRPSAYGSAMMGAARFWQTSILDWSKTSSFHGKVTALFLQTPILLKQALEFSLQYPWPLIHPVSVIYCPIIQPNWQPVPGFAKEVFVFP